ncbi:ABC transporter substrate binding protein [Phycisphaerae bacterium RAS1]|nr:ABC transporter substrate binding protein [Phycisphaerae bacterium RAS1]
MSPAARPTAAPPCRPRPLRRPVRAIIGIALLLLGAATGVFAGDADAPRALVLFPEKDVYREAADEILRYLRQHGDRVESIPLPAGDGDAQQRALERCRAERPALIITGGTALTADALREIPDVNVLFFMVPNAADAPFLEASGPHRNRVAGVSSDVAPSEQIEWVRHSAPRTRRLTLFYSERTRRTAEALDAAVRAAGVESVLVAARVDRFAEATDAAVHNGSDGVIMIPDSQIYNAASIQHLLLWGVREKRPVWAFSDKAVKAGAFAGIYADAGGVGRRCGELAVQMLAGKPPAEIGVVDCHTPQRAVNLHTAALIGISADDARRVPNVEVFGDKP